MVNRKKYADKLAKENNTTEIVVVLDRSGSMHRIQQDTIGGFNSFLEDQKQNKGKNPVKLSLVLFDHEYIPVFSNMDIYDVQPLNSTTYVPRGNTALLDAVGRTITELNSREDKPSKVLFVIITDGQENASREFKREQIKSLIEKAQSENKWEFVYLGANVDAFTESSQLGISSMNTANFAAHAGGVASTYTTLSSVARSYTNETVLDTATIQALNNQTMKEKRESN